ncbi:membrane protein [Cutibacterium acnes JCM 18916]|nr:membrane protein [Cutibacterium acnes JCM 18916]
MLFYIGGVNDTGQRDNKSIDFIGPATELIKGRKVNPFVIVFLPGKIRDGVDSECVDVGPYRHETWIMKIVIPRLESHYRVGHERGSRFIGGWSTGGYCAANLSTKYPRAFNAGFSLGGYYHPMFENPRIATWPDPLWPTARWCVGSRNARLSAACGFCPCSTPTICRAGGPVVYRWFRTGKSARTEASFTMSPKA